MKKGAVMGRGYPYEGATSSQIHSLFSKCTAMQEGSQCSIVKLSLNDQNITYGVLNTYQLSYVKASTEFK